jgi:hypothetical protein
LGGAAQPHPVRRHALNSILHVGYTPNGSFVLPIIGGLQASSHPQVKQVAAKWPKSDVSLLGASLSTKVTMLSLLASRLYSKLIPLQVELGQLADLDELIRGGIAWVPAQRNLPYELLLELDSFIFEFRSAYEILGKFMCAFSADILGKPIKEKDLLEILQKRGISTGWAKDLQERRKFWFHEHAPWIAYRVKRSDPLDSTVVFLSHVDADPDNQTESLDQGKLSQIYSGFDQALRELQAWALREIAALEK